MHRTLPLLLIVFAIGFPRSALANNRPLSQETTPSQVPTETATVIQQAVASADDPEKLRELFIECRTTECSDYVFSLWERAQWKACETGPNRSACEAYLVWHPQGPHRAEAEALLTPAIAQPPVRDAQPPARAQFAAKSGAYVGVTAAPGTTVTGDDLDGDMFFRSGNPPEVTVVPKLDSGNGLSFLVGYRGRSSAVEFAYIRSSHDGTWAGFPFATSLNRTGISGERIN